MKFSGNLLSLKVRSYYSSNKFFTTEAEKILENYIKYKKGRTILFLYKIVYENKIVRTF